MRASQTRGTQGRPDDSRSDGTKEEKIKAVFRAQARHLAALFPRDGDTMVARACAMAVSAAREVDKKSGGLKLDKISPELIAEKVIACHHLGLEIGDQASLVPYGTDLQLIVGPRGLIALMYRSGFVKSVEARSVFVGDEFDYELGSKKFIHHKKATAGRRIAQISHAYFIAETTTDGMVQEVLTAEDIEFYRGFSKAPSGPWFDNFEGMCRKTAIKRGAEFIPRSALLSAALQEDESGGYEIPDEIMAAVRSKTTSSPPAETGEVLTVEVATNGATA